ncbi:MAG: endonuclease/exonuclease/phosphatase family protein [Phycisphaerales bacterium JB040]
MRLLVWNILHGGGPRRTPGIVLAILDHRPDVVVLTEFRTTTGGQLAGVLHDHGLRHRLDSAPSPGRNGILIASRWGLERDPLGDRTAMGAKCLAARIEGVGVRLAAAHVPDARAHDHPALQRKSRCWNDLLHLGERWRSEPALLAGDFNTGRPGIDEDGRDTRVGAFTSAALMGKLTGMGYADAYRSLHPRGQERSWYSQQGRGFRLDHTLVSAPLAPRLRGVRYSQVERETRLSDHAPMLVDLSCEDPPRSDIAKNTEKVGVGDLQVRESCVTTHPCNGTD